MDTVNFIKVQREQLQRALADQREALRQAVAKAEEFERNEQQILGALQLLNVLESEMNSDK